MSNRKAEKKQKKHESERVNRLSPSMKEDIHVISCEVEWKKGGAE